MSPENPGNQRMGTILLARTAVLRTIDQLIVDFKMTT
jgi:hypothetical protein